MPVVSGDVDDETKDALDDMQQRGIASSRSEAVALAVERGLDDLGYRGSNRRQTGLRQIIQHAYIGSLWAVMVLAGLTWFGPLEVRLLVIGLLPVPIALFVVDIGLARVEPRVSEALVAALGGEPS